MVQGFPIELIPHDGRWYSLMLKWDASTPPVASVEPMNPTTCVLVTCNTCGNGIEGSISYVRCGDDWLAQCDDCNKKERRSCLV